MRYDTAVVRLGQSRDLPALRQASREADVGANVDRNAMRKQFSVLPYRAQTLADRRRGVYAAANFRLRRDGVDLDRILDEEGPEIGERVGYDEPLGRVQLAVQLKDYVEVVSSRLA